MVKAALLYADDVRLVSARLPLLHVLSAEQMRGFGPLVEELRARPGLPPDWAAGLVATLRARPEPVAQDAADFIAAADDPIDVIEAMASVWEDDLLPHYRESRTETHVSQLANFLPIAVGAFARRTGTPLQELLPAATDLRTAWKARVLSIELLHAERSFETADLDIVLRDVLGELVGAVVLIAMERGPSYPVFDDDAAHLINVLRPAGGGDALAATPASIVGPAGVAHSLIATLESFPMASMDVILDVRERLRPATTRFRAAMIRAATELDSADSRATLAAVAGDIRLREIDPALADITEALEELGVRDTLLRGWPKVAAGTLGLAAAAAMKAPELAQYVPVAAGLSAAYATEIARRRAVARDVKRRPLFFLHAAERYLAETIDDHARQ